jgi:hypothetical protein
MNIDDDGNDSIYINVNLKDNKNYKCNINNHFFHTNLIFASCNGKNWLGTHNGTLKFDSSDNSIMYNDI